jgi:hypothetical protein
VRRGRSERPKMSWPPGLRDYIDRCFGSCDTAEQKDVMDEILREQITVAKISGNLWKKDWLQEVVPASPASWLEVQAELREAARQLQAGVDRKTAERVKREALQEERRAKAAGHDERDTASEVKGDTAQENRDTKMEEGDTAQKDEDECDTASEEGAEEGGNSKEISEGDTVSEEELTRSRPVFRGAPRRLRRLLLFQKRRQAELQHLRPTRLQLGLPAPPRPALTTPARPRPPGPRGVRLAPLFDQLEREGQEEVWDAREERAGEEGVGGREGCGGSPDEPSGRAAHVGSNQKFLSVLPTSAQPAEESGERHTPLHLPCPPSPALPTLAATCALSPYSFPPHFSPWAWGSVVAGLQGPGLAWDAQCCGCGAWSRVIPIVPTPA